MWKDENKSIKIINRTNAGGEIIYWTVDGDNCTHSGFYTQSSLYLTEIEDENENTTREYKDGQGKVILISSYLSGYWLKTYYVYDIFNRLRFVIPPEASKKIETGSSFSTVSETLCYLYKYDSRGRMIEKKLPGADAIFLIYDKRDLLILSQDGNMRNTNDWMFTKYDALKRPIITGIYHAGIPQNNMQSFYDNMFASTSWETYNNLTHKYSDDSFPFVYNTSFSCTIYSEMYYDSYNLPNSFNGKYDYTYTDENLKSDAVKGMITASKTYILDHEKQITPEYLITVNYYDKRGRVIQTIGDNHKQGLDRITNTYSFAGEVLATKHKHTTYSDADLPSPDVDVIIYKEFEYDHAGRLLRTYEKLHFDDPDKRSMK